MAKKYNELPDEDLIRLVQKDNLDAFDVLAHRYEKKLFNFLYRFVSNVAPAEDLSQQVLLRVYRARMKFREQGKYSTWMYTIAANLARDYLRKHKRYHFVSFDQPAGNNSNLIDFYQPPEPPKITEAEQQERAEIVRLAVESLPEPQKMAIILSHYQSLNYNDIARILKCSKGTVKSRVFRAKLKLKQLLTDYMMGKEKERVSDEVQKDNKNTSGISR